MYQKIGLHRAAIALHIAFYNFCRVHETLRVTPAMELELTDHIWSIAELMEEAQATPLDPPPLEKPPAYAARPPTVQTADHPRGQNPAALISFLNHNRYSSATVEGHLILMAIIVAP